MCECVCVHVRCGVCAQLVCGLIALFVCLCKVVHSRACLRLWVFWLRAVVCVCVCCVRLFTISPVVASAFTVSVRDLVAHCETEVLHRHGQEIIVSSFFGFLEFLTKLSISH